MESLLYIVHVCVPGTPCMTLSVPHTPCRKKAKLRATSYLIVTMCCHRSPHPPTPNQLAASRLAPLSP
jgi:hypothetical protein